MPGWNDYGSAEVRALRGISQRSEKPNRDLEKNVQNLNQSVRYMGQMMTIMQNGIDEANMDILQQIQSAIEDILIIFGLAGGDTLSFDWGDLDVVLKNLKQIFRLDLFNVPFADLDLIQIGQSIWDLLFGWIDLDFDISEILSRIFGPNGLIRFDILPTLPLSIFAPTTPNLLANGGFDGPESIPGGVGWEYDATVGRTSLGSAKYTVRPGEMGVQLSTPIQTAEGQKVNAETYVKWAGLSGLGTGLSAAIRWYNGTSIISDTQIGSIAAPASSGDWTKIEATDLVAPAGADSMCMVLKVEEGFTAGSVWFDDCVVKKPSTSFPQEFVEGLVGALTDIADWLESLVDHLLGSIGLPDVGDLFDKIISLGDGIGDWLADTQDQAASLINLINGLLNSPDNFIGSLPIAKITGLVSALANKAGIAVEQFLLDLANAILSGIRKVPIVGGSIASRIQDVLDDIFDLKSQADDTAISHQELNNAVWSGANETEQAVNKTETEVQQAVAALKSRAEALRQENELRYQSAIPLWQGLAPGGDITCPMNDLVIGNGSGPTIVNWAVSGNTGSDNQTPLMDHTHTAGSLTVGINYGSGSIVKYGMSPFSAFRARSDSERNWITFLARTNRSLEEFVALLWTYRYDDDKWEVVGFTENVAAEIDSAAPGWVNARLMQPYSPQVGELMAVSWSMYFNGSSGGEASVNIGHSASINNFPAYDSVPYGNHASMTQILAPHANNYSPIGIANSLPKIEGGWSVGSQSFAQIAPDLGQIASPSPTYFFDDFNSSYSDNYIYRNGAFIKNGQFEYNGITDGYQSITLKKQMSTVNNAIEASLNGAESLGASISMHTNQNQGYGVWLSVHDDAAILFTGDVNGNTTERARASLSNIAARWKIEYQDSSKRYLVYKDNNLVLQWTDSGNLANRDKGRRSVSLRVNRAFFNNSPAWDDLLVYDVAQP